LEFMSPPRLLLTAFLLAVGALLSPLGVGAALAHPAANFEWAPNSVVAGATVTFTSTSTPFHDETEAETPIIGYAWDLHGRGTCRELLPGATCTVTAPASGDWDVTLTVTDLATESDSITKTVAVETPPPPGSPPNQPPRAAFAAIPASPLVGEEVTFVSFSDDRDGRITGLAWDLDGDNRFDDGDGPIVTGRFTVPGTKTVRLRVRDDRGATSTESLAVLVRAQGGPASTSPPTATRPIPRLLSPFPIVRLVGGVTSLGTDIKVLSVRAPKGARALVRCRGRACPVSRLYKRVRRRRPVRFRAVERLMPAGVVLEVLVRRGDRIGKFTRFKLRRNRRPVRRDGCLWPRTNRMAPCPED
jgi:PKD domain